MRKSKRRKLTKKKFEAKQNLSGFFGLLFKIDKRINPQNYKKNENDRNTNNTN